MSVWNPPVPAGDDVADHYDHRCRQPWDWCVCPEDEDAICGDFRFANCVLPLGHAGICEERPPARELWQI